MIDTLNLISFFILWFIWLFIAWLFFLRKIWIITFFDYENDIVDNNNHNNNANNKNSDIIPMKYDWTLNWLKLPYFKKQFFFDVSEREFYNILKEVVKNKYTIFAKPRLIDIFWVSKWGFVYKSKIIQKHVDFLLCNNVYYNPICWIEVDWYSHNYKKERDDVVNQVFASANLKLIRINTNELKDVNKLKERILKELS